MATRIENDAPAGACAITGNSDGPFVVTDYIASPQLLLNGPIAIKISILLELAEMAGAIRPETHFTALASLAEAHAKIQELETENARVNGENNALIVLVGGKLGARANHIRKEAGFSARKEFDKTRDFVNESVVGETPTEIEAAHVLAMA